MIFWRSGLAGFKGAAKRLIKGVLSVQYTAPSAIIVIVDDVEPLVSVIDGNGISAQGLVTESFGVLSLITESTGVTSAVSSNGRGVTSTITETGFSVSSTI